MDGGHIWMRKVYRRRTCGSCKKRRKCVKESQSFFCLDCFNQFMFKADCNDCAWKGRFCKKHKVREFK